MSKYKNIFTPADAGRIAAWLTSLKYHDTRDTHDTLEDDVSSEEARICPCCGEKSKVIMSHFTMGSAKMLFWGYFIKCLNPELSLIHI